MRLKSTVVVSFLLVSALLIAGLAWGSARPLPVEAKPLAAPLTPGDITISNTVVITGIEPIGMNISTIAGGTNYAINNYVWGSGMEPAIARYLVRIEATEVDTDGTWIAWELDGGNVHMWDVNATGFGDGAVVRLYRLVDANGQPLAYAEGMQDATGADHVIFLGETTVPAGGWIAEGSESENNRVYLTDSFPDLAFGDYAIIIVKKTELPAEQVHPRLYEWFESGNRTFSWYQDTVSATLVPHPGTIPAEFTDPGETCLQMTFPEGNSGWFGQYIFHSYDQGEGQWYGQLVPGAHYRASVWLRQEGLPNGQVRFVINGPYSALAQQTPWTVTGEWRQYTYDFVAPDYPTGGSHAGLGFELTGPGTVWFDNFLVYQYDAAHNFAPFTPNRVSFDELMAAMPLTGAKPAVRFYPTSYAGHDDMAHLLSNYGNSRIDFIYNIQAGEKSVLIPQIMGYAMATGDTPEERIIPYITVSEEYTEIEWMQLVEYLGVPYDPATDTPTSKPWAYLRYQQRGIGTPWTDEFREIVLEFGNESWHNGAFGGWHGFGRPGWVHFGGREYGLFAHYYFVENVMAQPWWNEYNLDAKIRLALNANYSAELDSYGELAVQGVPTLTTYLGHANYVGPKWETGETPHQAFDDHGMQETLIAAYTDMYGLIDKVAETREYLMAQGLADYAPIAYEGGPSGYYVPGQGTVTQTAISQLYGKSQGMGVAAMDVWLYSSLNGYKHQEMFGFASGDNWTSHTMPLAGGFRRHSGWLSLMMRNRYASGDTMLQTTLNTYPSYTREGVEVPLLTAYTISDTDSLSLFVLSRKLGGVHDNADFGDGTTPVTVHFPPRSCAALTRYALTAPDGSPTDPRVNNTDEENIALTSVSLDTALCAAGELVIGPDTGGVAGGMPQGTVYLYVFDQTAPAEAYTLTVNTIGQGAVTRDPQGETVVLPISYRYEPGTQITLTAQPATGWVFSGWSGSLTGNANPAHITLNSDRTITATFTASAPSFRVYLPLTLRQYSVP